jgi:hypothetical protein
VSTHTTDVENDAALANSSSDRVGPFIEGKTMILSECRNPYPHAFDLGIITTMARNEIQKKYVLLQ